LNINKNYNNKGGYNNHYNNNKTSHVKIVNEKDKQKDTKSTA